MGLTLFDTAMAEGRLAHSLASRIGDGWLRGWRLRKFLRQLERFISALRHVPQSEAHGLTAARLRACSTLVDSIINDAEAAIAARKNPSPSQLNNDRQVVSEIYELRAIVESLTRHVTADPEFMDVNWTVRTETANRKLE
jgi:hypothetical protein